MLGMIIDFQAPVGGSCEKVSAFLDNHINADTLEGTLLL
jgi:hypothetical protein